MEYLNLFQPFELGNNINIIKKDGYQLVQISSDEIGQLRKLLFETLIYILRESRNCDIEESGKSIINSSSNDSDNLVIMNFVFDYHQSAQDLSCIDEVKYFTIFLQYTHGSHTIYVRQASNLSLLSLYRIYYIMIYNTMLENYCKYKHTKKFAIICNGKDKQIEFVKFMLCSLLINSSVIELTKADEIWVILRDRDAGTSIINVRIHLSRQEKIVHVLDHFVSVQVDNQFIDNFIY